MALARAVLQNPRMLILDEATSALDATTERQVCLNLFEAFRGRTVFFITHRLSTVRPADFIVLMDQGVVMETGEHNGLMQRQGWYYALVQSQAQEVELMLPSDEAPWSFNQPVLLKKNRRTSSVLVWTLAGGTLFAAAWAFLAPLPQTVAVQGKLQPASGTQSIDAPVPGVIEEVAVVEGQRVGRGDVLLRFDDRDAQAKLISAQRNRNRLQNQITINRVVLGEEPIASLSDNQELFWEAKPRTALATGPLSWPPFDEAVFASTGCVSHSKPQQWWPPLRGSPTGWSQQRAAGGLGPSQNSADSDRPGGRGRGADPLAITPQGRPGQP